MEFGPQKFRHEICSIGTIFEEDKVPFLIMAADELNITEPTVKYEVNAGFGSFFSWRGNRLPEGTRRIIITGSWTKTGENLNEFFNRVNEIQAEFDQYIP